MERIGVAEDNPAFCSRDGVLFTKDGKTLVLFPRGRKEKTYAVPPDVAAIGDHAFGWALLESVVIPEGVTEIGECAFQLSALKSVVVPASVTHIFNYAFANCESLTVRAPRGSYTERYAKENGVKFEPLD